MREGTVILTIPLKAPLMTPNGQRRSHWTAVAKAKDQTEMLVSAAMGKAGLRKIKPPISVRVIWFAPDARRRDVDSLSVFAKSCLDALKKRKVITDDDSTNVYEVHLGPIVISRDAPRIEIHIKGLEGRGFVSDG